MSAIVIIPARFNSSRFGGKPIYPILGKPMIQYVYEKATKARFVKEVFVATDNILIFDTVERFGGKVIMTSDSCKSGTDRIGEAVRILINKGLNIDDSDIIINVQGDEPLIMPEMIEDVIDIMKDKYVDIGTLAKKITKNSEIFDPDVVKVVFTQDGKALYFSRYAIPYHRELLKNKNDDINLSNLYIFKHIGLYGFRKKSLFAFSSLPTARLEHIEKLEQLRALENGFLIKIKETFFDTINVDKPEDIERVEQCLNTSL